MRRCFGWVHLAARIFRGLLFEEKISDADRARRALTMTCLRLARSDFGDEDAVARLRELIKTDLGSAERSAERMAEHRDSYVSDRAYRLLVAAMANSQVSTVRPDLQARFERERELGLMPIGDAFLRLVEVVPALADVVADIERNSATSMTVYIQRAKSLMDMNRERVGSRIATGLVMEYLGIIAGDTSRGDASTPYFRIRDQPMVTETASRISRTG